MKKVLLVLSVVVLFASCPGTLPDDTGVPGEETPPVDLPHKFLAIGDDFTMGIQSAGLSQDFQLNSYPYLVSAQAAAAGLSNVFEQPIVSAPGIGALYLEPLGLVENRISTTSKIGDASEEELLVILLERLANTSLQRPYNNLGINGAKLADLSSTTSSADSETGDNFFFDIVLRNLALPGVPNFGGKTALQQVTLIDEKAPTDTTVIMVWIGINDIVGAAISGGDLITPAGLVEFETQYDALLTSLSTISSNIVVANLPSYVPFFYVLDTVFDGDTAMMFNIFGMFGYGGDLEPVDFDDGEGVLNVPLDIAEAGATHLLLTAGLEYWQNGLGIPAESELELAGLDPGTIAGIMEGRSDVGLPIPEEMTLTDSEVTDLLAAITACNTIIEGLAATHGCGLVDINTIMLDKDTMTAAVDYSGDYYLSAPNDTFFSLDALHPSNLGYAVIANAFIEAINLLDVLDADLALLNTAAYTGQYVDPDAG
jgi:hypothetical protein